MCQSIKGYNVTISGEIKHSQFGEQVVISFKIYIKEWVKMSKFEDFVHVAHYLKARSITC